MIATRKNDHRLMQVLLGPVISEKATFVADKNEQVVFQVARDANKLEIKAAVELGGSALGVGEGLTSLLIQGQGYAINPQLQMLYQGLPLRSFSLTFLFSPKSRQEAQVVNQIIHTLKYCAAPSLEVGKLASIDSMFLVPPYLFDVSFIYKNSPNTYLPKYDYCALESITVDHTPNGFAAHTDGSPVQTVVTLDFQELYLVDSKDINNGY